MISLLVAYTKNKRVIGAQGKIPWKLSSERNRFKQICNGKYVIMGRKSFEEIGKPPRIKPDTGTPEPTGPAAEEPAELPGAPEQGSENAGTGIAEND